MKLVRIKQVKPLDGLNVRLILSDDREVDRDLDFLLKGRPFNQLRTDRTLFEQVSVQDGTLTWPGDIDLCPDMVIWGGPPPMDASVDTA